LCNSLQQANSINGSAATADSTPVAAAAPAVSVNSPAAIPLWLVAQGVVLMVLIVMIIMLMAVIIIKL
jgi:hypothetical protein